MIERHGVLYAEEYGWRGPFEGMCAGIISDFVKTGEESHDDWGGKATSEFWDLEL